MCGVPEKILKKKCKVNSSHFWGIYSCSAGKEIFVFVFVGAKSLLSSS